MLIIKKGKKEIYKGMVLSNHESISTLREKENKNTGEY